MVVDLVSLMSALALLKEKVAFPPTSQLSLEIWLWHLFKKRKDTRISKVDFFIIIFNLIVNRNKDTCGGLKSSMNCLIFIFISSFVYLLTGLLTTLKSIQKATLKKPCKHLKEVEKRY